MVMELSTVNESARGREEEAGRTTVVELLNMGCVPEKIAGSAVATNVLGLNESGIEKVNGPIGFVPLRMMFPL